MRTFALLLLLTVVGCASTGTGSSSASTITREEILEANQMTALDLVRTVRPHWLNTRGPMSLRSTPMVVYVDGMRAGGVEALADIGTTDVEEVRYYDPREAQFRFGTGHAQGAIEVLTH